MITFVLLGAVSLLTGQGILSLGKIHTKSSITLYLSPIITLSFWTVFLAWGVLLGFSIKQLWIIGWSATIFLAIIGSRRIDFEFLKKEKASLAALVIFPAVLMFPYFWYGLGDYLGSTAPDGWSYIAYGQYLWEYPRGAEGSLAPLYQYAAHLNGTRFIASALLAFFSPILWAPGDTQIASGFFLAWSLFAFSSACIFFVKVKKYSGFFLFVYVSFSALSGWLINLLSTNNFDNALAISFLPALAGAIYLAEPTDHWWGFLWGLLIAGILYIYPEMAIFVIGGAFLFYVHRLSGAMKKREWLTLLFLSFGLAAILLVPFSKDLVTFLKSQISISVGNPGVRPGEGYFPELLTKEFALLAFWGFRKSSTASSFLHSFVALLLSLLAAWGILGLLRKKEWGILATILLLFAGSLLMIFHFHYSYGAYKLILLNWWGICFLTIEGMKQLRRRNPYPKSQWAIGILLILFLIINGATISNQANRKNTILPFKQVEKIKDIVRDEAIIVDVGEDLANEWAVYFLRDIPIYLAEYRLYMAQSHVAPLMQRAKAVNLSQIRYVLVDSQQPQLFQTGRLYSVLWSGGPYSLLQVDLEKSEPALECQFVGFGSRDFVNMSEKAAPDGQFDAMFILDIKTSGKIISIELHNTGGVHSVWDTIPGNGHVLLGVADSEKPGSLLNKPDGSVAIDVHRAQRLFLYAADNSSLKDGKTKYQVTIRLNNGHMASVPIKQN